MRGYFMKDSDIKYVKIYLVAGFLFTAVLGTLSHFFYEWSGRNPLIALFSPVNESTWEHMKLVFFPAFLWALVMPAGIQKSFSSLRPALLLGGLLGTLGIPVLFYTYSGILGHNVTFADISIFFIGIAIVFFTAWKLKNSGRVHACRNLIYVLTLLFTFMFFTFTFLPPQIGLFAEP